MPTELYKEHQEYCDRRSEVLCEEKGVKYTLINDDKHETTKIKVDRGIFPVTDQHPR